MQLSKKTISLLFNKCSIFFTIKGKRGVKYDSQILPIKGKYRDINMTGGEMGGGGGGLFRCS